MSPLGLLGRRKPNKFEYASPLDSESIRLVRFAGHRRRADKLDLKISTHGLVEILNYHALSYTWGPPEGSSRYKNSDLQPILLDGKNATSSLACMMLWFSCENLARPSTIGLMLSASISTIDPNVRPKKPTRKKNTCSQ